MNQSSVLWWSIALNALAVFAAPLIALYLQRRADERRRSAARRQEIFNVLWVNRTRPFWIARTDALNRIDIEFYDEPKVREAWQDLFAHYNAKNEGVPDPQVVRERGELYVTLLYELSQALGYRFAKSYIRDNAYRPSFHGEVDQIEIETRRRVLDLLRGDALPVRFIKEERAAQQNGDARQEMATDADDIAQ